MIDAAAHFSHSYSEARDRFLAAATARAMPVRASVHPAARGPDDGELAVDSVVAGDSAARAVLVVSSGTHGVEGHAGSGIQRAWVMDDDAQRAVERSGVRVVLLHALDPWGFAHDARGDDNNVDLNRNFRDFGTPQPNMAYAALHSLLVPGRWPPGIGNEALLWLAMFRQGRRRFQQSVSCGQAEHADGLFYAGREATWSHRTLRALLRAHTAGCTAVGWIDLHTGLGPRGHVETIFNGPDDADTLARARRWWGSQVKSMYDGSSASSAVTGANFGALDEVAASACASVTLEAGTLPPRAVLAALRARQWLANHPDAPRRMRTAILAQSRAAFIVESDDWKRGCYAEARAAMLRGCEALQHEAARA